MKRKAYIGVSLAVAVALAAVLGERWWHPRYDRIHFSGGGHYERVAVGDFVTAIRHKSVRELLRVSGEKRDRPDPEAVKGAAWLLANYSGRLDGTIGVTYGEPAVSSLELNACLSLGKGKGGGGILSISGLADSQDRPYRIDLAIYPPEPIDPRVPVHPDPTPFCNGR